MRRLGGLLIVVCISGCPGEDAAARRAQERLKKAEAEKAEKKKRSAELDAQRQQALKGEPSLGAPWDDAKLLVPDSPCPIGVWALFPGPAPAGADEADRADMAGALSSEVYFVKLRAPDVIAPTDSTVEVKGSIQCTDGPNRVRIAWTAAKDGVAPPVALGGSSHGELAARVAFKLRSGELSAGVRLIHADLVAVRVTTGAEQSLVVERK
jgi:hypothetical protein